MTTHSRWFLLLFMALASALIASAEEGAPASEPEEDEDRIGWVVVEASVWISQATGAEFDVATDWSGTQPSVARVRSLEPGESESGRYRAGYSLSHNLGDIAISWWTHGTEQGISMYSPGDFRYGEIFAYPIFAGVFDDGMADGFDAASRIEIRDLRVDYSRIGYESPRTTARWILGYRDVTHRREKSVVYHSIFPVYDGTPIAFPIPPTGMLVPVPDVAAASSKFSGHGPEFGFQIDFPFHKRVRLETGLLAALLRGSLETAYSSSTSTYVVVAKEDAALIEYYALPPFPEFEAVDEDDDPYLPRIRQLSFPIGLRASEKADVQVLDAHAILRWNVWRGMEVFAGYRATRYDGAAAEMRPKIVTLNPSGTYNLQEVTRIEKSVSYEGLVGGVTYRF